MLYVITFAASIPELKLYSDVVDKPRLHQHPRQQYAAAVGRVARGHHRNRLYREGRRALPGHQRVSQTAALGFVSSRVVEATLIVAGVLSLLSVVTLRGDFAGSTGAQQDALGVTGQALVAVRQWTCLLGPDLIPGVNALFLGYLMYRSGPPPFRRRLLSPPPTRRCRSADLPP